MSELIESKECKVYQVPDGVYPDRMGLVIDRKLDWEQCQALVDHINLAQVAIQWWVGDLLNYTNGLFGEEYMQLFSKWDEHTFDNWQWVAGAIPLSRRREKLSWSHHATVAGLIHERQDYFLSSAEQNDWSVSELRRQIKGNPQKKKKQMECPQCHHIWEVE